MTDLEIRDAIWTATRAYHTRRRANIRTKAAQERTNYLAGETRHLLDYRLTPTEIAAKLHTSPSALARRFHRYSIHDLARIFDRKTP